MNKLQSSVLILILSVLISSVSQILLKLSANRKHTSWLSEYLNLKVILGYGMLFCSTILTMLALRHVPLSWSPVIESLGYIFVAVLGVLFLKEKISRRKFLGMGLILLGVFVFHS